jgi:eukaryotic-like serine/threonine-protein kinase
MITRSGARELDATGEESGLAVSGTWTLLASRYRLREQIAAGGTGEVWRADDAVLGRAVAVKLLRPEYAGHAETLARFQAEARHAGRLAHPGIVQVFDYGQDHQAGVPFLVMELIDGPSLAAVLAGGPQRPPWVLDMIGQVAAGLAAAHAVGLVHRDIKPANLLLAPGGIVKITDFGIASAAGSAPLTQAGMLACTPGYLAPERAAGSLAGPASDLYSLGIVAWEALIGRPPFTGTPLDIALAHAHRDLPPLPASVPAGLAALVAALTAGHPAARPSGAAVAAQAGQLRAALTAGAPLLSGQPAGQHARPAATLTLTGITAHDSPPLRQRLSGSSGWPGEAALLAAASLAAAIALAAVLAAATAGTARQQPAPAGPSAASAVPAARTVTIDNAALDGQPAAAVLAKLRQAGLRPRLVQLPDGRQQPGTVITIQPAGPVPAGATVTVTVAMPPPSRRHHHGNGGNGD